MRIYSQLERENLQAGVPLLSLSESL
jgi:hypothetical protein